MHYIKKMFGCLILYNFVKLTSLNLCPEGNYSKPKELFRKASLIIPKIAKSALYRIDFSLFLNEALYA